jgi:hypothetical protein
MNARAFVLALPLVLFGAASCDKGGTTKPAGGTGSAPVEGAVVLRYKVDAAKLQQRGTFDMNTTGGGQFGEALVRYTAALELVPSGDKIKVVWGLSEVSELATKGMFADPAATDDPKAVLLAEGKGAFLVDAKGKLDESATEKLAENAARRERFEKLEADAKASGGAPAASTGLRMLALTDTMVTLPDLPEAGLAVGTPLVVEEEEEAQMSGIVLPTETEMKYTLVKIDTSGTSRIAELEIEGVTSGATEVPGGMLTVDVTTEGTMLFDIDGGFPVRYQITRSQAFAFGNNTVESTIMLESTFDRGQ